MYTACRQHQVGAHGPQCVCDVPKGFLCRWHQLSQVSAHRMRCWTRWKDKPSWRGRDSHPASALPHGVVTLVWNVACECCLWGGDHCLWCGTHLMVLVSEYCLPGDGDGLLHVMSCGVSFEVGEAVMSNETTDTSCLGRTQLCSVQSEPLQLS